MSLWSEIHGALEGLVGGRAYPMILPLQPAVPVTPAIRYQFVSAEVTQDVCGGGESITANRRVQVDIYSANFIAGQNLREQVIAAMAGLTVPAAWDGGFDDYEPETKLYRCSLDFITYPSSA